MDIQVLPAAAGDQVSTPAVSELVGNNINVLLVTTDDGRGSKGEDGVLHAYGPSSDGKFSHNITHFLAFSTHLRRGS